VRIIGAPFLSGAHLIRKPLYTFRDALFFPIDREPVQGQQDELLQIARCIDENENAFLHWQKTYSIDRTGAAMDARAEFRPSAAKFLWE